MNKQGKYPLGILLSLILVVALILWYIFFSGEIRAQVLEIMKNFLR